MKLIFVKYALAPLAKFKFKTEDETNVGSSPFIVNPLIVAKLAPWMIMTFWAVEETTLKVLFVKVAVLEVWIKEMSTEDVIYYQILLVIKISAL